MPVMRVIRRAGPAAALILCSLPLHGGEAPWLEVKSAHFTVVTNSGEKSGRRMAWRFEQVRAVYQQLWPWANLGFGRPVVVLAVRDENSLKALAPEYWERKGYRPTSVFVSGQDRHYAALRTDLGDPSDNGVNPHFSVFSSYAFLVIDSNFPNDTPQWFKRGLAEFLANTVVRDKEVHYGRSIQGNISLLREGAFIPMGTLVTVAGDSPYLTRESESQFFDAQSWALVHFLMFGDKGAHAPKINRFAQLLREERGADAALREALGDPSAYGPALKSYVDGAIFAYQRIPIAVQVKEEGFAARPLGPAETAAVQASFHAAMGRPVEARALVEQSRKADARLPGPWEAEARLLDRENKRDEAKAAYAKAVELGSDSFHAHYRLAHLLWTPGLDRAGYTALAGHLEKSVQLNPEYANAQSLLAQAKGELGLVDEGLALARKAVALEPNEPYHRLVLARLLWDQRQPDQAKVEAQGALRRARSDDERREARELLAFLEKNAPPPK